MNNRFGLIVTATALVVAAVLIVYLAIGLALTPSPALAGAGMAQTTTPPADTGISVSGTGKVSVKPDVAISTIGIQVTSSTLADATSQANNKMSAVIDKIKSMGVADKDIQTTNYSVQPITNQPKSSDETPTITGYRIDNQVRVTVRKIDDLGKILDAAVSAGANSIYGISFSVADPAPYEQQARAAAVKDAQNKAAQLAQAGGLTLGKIVSISENVASPRPVFAAAAPSLAGGGAVPVETGEMQVTVSVDVRFAIQ
jgi:uncharacterized protein YggE